MYIYMYIYIYVYIYICIYIYIFIFICLYVYMFIYLYIYIFIYLYICIIVYLYIYIIIYLYMKLLGKCGSLTPINPESIGAVPKGSSLVLCGEGGGVRGLSLPSHPPRQHQLCATGLGSTRRFPAADAKVDESS